MLAILLGVAIRTAWTPGRRWLPGISFSAKTLLEVAVVLLGASVSARTVLALGPALLGGIARSSPSRSRQLRHRPRSRPAAAHGHPGRLRQLDLRQLGDRRRGPGDRRGRRRRRLSIAFTAVLGVIVVLLLPLLVPVLLLSLTQYGVLAGLTVYAVPQVLAATLPIGALQQPGGHRGQAGARADAGPGRARPVAADAAAARRDRRGGAATHRGRPAEARPARRCTSWCRGSSWASWRCWRCARSG